MNSLPLHDIKSLTQIPDYSFYFFVAIIIMGLTVLLAILYSLIQYFKNKNDSKKESLKILQNITFKDVKKDAYLITHHARKLISNEREKKLYEELYEELAQYKYKKEVSTIKKQTQQKFKIFMDAL